MRTFRGIDTMGDITWGMNKQQQEAELLRRVQMDNPKCIRWETCGMAFIRPFSKEEWERIGRLNGWELKAL